MAYLDICPLGRYTVVERTGPAIRWFVWYFTTIKHSVVDIWLRSADTMFELVKALNDGAEELRKRIPNPIGLNAGCELFIAFVTLFPHESNVCISSASCAVRASH